LSEAARKHLAHAARDNDIDAVRLMLLAGLPLDGRSVDKGTALHWAAVHGNVEMVRLLIQHEQRPSCEPLVAREERGP